MKRKVCNSVILRLLGFSVFLVCVLTACPGFFDTTPDEIEEEIPEEQDNTDNSGENLTNTEVLRALGFEPETGPRTDSSGNPLPVDNPYGTKVTNINKTDEIFTVTAQNIIQLKDYLADGSTNAVSLGTTAFTDSAGLIKRPVAADTDGDGKEEIITAVFSVAASTISMYRITDGSTHQTVAAGSIAWNREHTDYPGIQDFTNSSEQLNQTHKWNHTIDIASGDIDGDEKEEVLITSEGTLYVLDDDLTEIMRKPFTSIGAEGSQILRVECADLTYNGRAEIVVANGSYEKIRVAEVNILQYESGQTLSALVSNRAVSAASLSVRAAEIKIGDVTGDGTKDVVLAGMQTNDDRYIITHVLSVVVDGSGTLSAEFINHFWSDTLKSGIQNFWMGWQEYAARDATIPILGVADLDMDGVSEIVAGDDVIRLNAMEDVSGAVNYEFAAAWDTSSDDILRAGAGTSYRPGWGNIWGWRAADTAYFNQVQVSDISGDGIPEIVVIDYKRTKLRIYRYNANTLQVEYKGDVALLEDQYDSGAHSPYLCLADIDQDGLILEYVGHSLEYSEPVIVAVLASPPYWDEKTADGQNIQYYDGACTSFAITAGGDAGAGSSFSAGITGTIGAKGTIPAISNGEVQLTTSCTTTVSGSFDVSVSTEAEYELTANAGTDYVIFSAIPIDFYLYEVKQVNPENNPDELSVGDYVNTSFERGAKLHMTSIEFYNNNNGDYPDIDNTILSHTIGNPKSYLTKAEAHNIIDINPMSYLLEQVGSGLVPEGNSYNTITYTNSVRTGAEISYEVERTLDFEVSFVLVLGASVSHSTGVSASVGATVGSSVSGTVGGLLGEFYSNPDYKFDWGLCSYPVQLQGSFPFVVVNYWVD